MSRSGRKCRHCRMAPTWWGNNDKHLVGPSSSLTGLAGNLRHAESFS